MHIANTIHPAYYKDFVYNPKFENISVYTMGKQEIIKEIKKALNGKVERLYIIGSFLDENWDRYKSDIDLVCIDHSFINFSYSTNLKAIKENLAKLNFHFDIFLFTWNQFIRKVAMDSQFKLNIEGGMKLL